MGYSLPGDLSDTLPTGSEDRILSEIEPGERLVWTGRPRPSRVLGPTIPIGLLGLLWTAFSAFWVGAALRLVPLGAGIPLAEGFRIVLAVLGLPFVAVGLVMIAAPGYAMRRAALTAYALTDRRAILIEPMFSGGYRTISLRPGQFGPMERIERADGSGDLMFGPGAWSRATAESETWTPRGFLGIAQVRAVESLVRQARLDVVLGDSDDRGAAAIAGRSVNRTTSGGQP